MASEEPENPKFEISVKVSEEATNSLVATVVDLLSPFSESFGYLGDVIRHKRLENIYKAAKRAKQIADEKGIEPKCVPLKFLAPWLEGCSLEEEYALTEAWAGLLASAGETFSPLHNTYVRLLAQLEAEDAVTLEIMWCQHSSRVAHHFDAYDTRSRDEEFQGQMEIGAKSIDELTDRLRSSGRLIHMWRGDDIPNTNEFNLSGFDPALRLLHLQSLGIIEIRAASTRVMEKDEIVFVLVADLTPLGEQFVSACHRGDPD